MDIHLFVLGYYIQLLASGALLLRVTLSKSVAGISFDSQALLLISALARLIWVYWTRLVQTRFMAVLVYAELGLSIASSVFLIRSMFKSGSLRRPAEKLLRYESLTMICMFLSLLVNPGNKWVTMQILVAFSIYVEAAVLFPQLHTLRKTEVVETLTSHFLGLLILARFVRMIFWGYLFFQGQKFLGLFAADVIHTVLSADFFYLWFRKLRYGEQINYQV